MRIGPGRINGLPRLYTPREVARRFGVNPRTVNRWAGERRMGAVRTPGGQWRFHGDLVEQEYLASIAARGLPEEPAEQVWAGQVHTGPTHAYHALDNPQGPQPQAACNLRALQPPTIRPANQIPATRWCRRPGCMRTWWGAPR